MVENSDFPPYIWRREPYLISTEFDKLDAAFIHRWLAEESYWARGISKASVERSLQHSLCFGLFDCAVHDEDTPVGFARVITDYTTFAYVADVFVVANYRGRGLGKWLISCILAHPEMQDLRKWMLNTKDAHTLYERFGFKLHAEHDTYMVFRPTVPGGTSRGQLVE
jgi:GNAT superfamily N-acetyltransferase